MAYFDSDSHLKVHLPMIYINQVVFAVPYGVSIGFNVWSPEPWLNTTRPPRNQWHPMAGATLMMLALEVDQTWHPITHSEARPNREKEVKHARTVKIMEVKEPVEPWHWIWSGSGTSWNSSSAHDLPETCALRNGDVGENGRPAADIPSSNTKKMWKMCGLEFTEGYVNDLA